MSDETKNKLSVEDALEFVYREGVYELRRPLTNASLYIQVLLRSSGLSEEQLADLHTLAEQISDARGIVTKLASYCFDKLHNDKN